jgi:hypothetical protein
MFLSLFFSNIKADENTKIKKITIRPYSVAVMEDL